MLIAAERLLIKLRQPASRAAELIALRARLRADRADSIPTDERALAATVHARKQDVNAALHSVASCASCATGQPFPVGYHDGGACCSGITEHIFDDAELSALALAGTRPRDLTPPRDPHAGCAFRGATGCSLTADHRPARCVHYVCTTLRRELHGQQRLDDIEQRLAALNDAMAAYTVALRARRDRETLAPLVDALLGATTK